MLKKGESYYAGVGSNKAHITPEMMYKAMAAGSVTATDTSTGDKTPAYEKNRKKNNESKISGSDSPGEDKKTEGKSPIDRLKESFNLLKEAFSPDMVELHLNLALLLDLLLIVKSRTVKKIRQTLLNRELKKFRHTNRQAVKQSVQCRNKVHLQVTQRSLVSYLARINMT